MKKALLVSLAVSTGMFSIVFAVNSISNHIEGDLYFHNEVMITSGVTYQSSQDEDTGSASVVFDGNGSLTIGKMLGQGFPRVVMYSGSTLTVSQDFTGKEKKWWAGKIKAPGKVLDIPNSLVEWENKSNHMVGDTQISATYGFESVTETYKFSVESYVVLPVEAPDNAKIWYVFHSIDPENFADAEPVEIVENNFCIVQDNLCVVPVTEMNQVALIEESFERCPRSEVPNGSVGSIPYCVIACSRGYELDDSAIACTELEGGETGETEEIFQQTEETHEAAPTSGMIFAGLSGEELEKAINQARLEGIGKFDYQSGHYTGQALTLIDTSELSGDDLRTALRRNAQINKRRGVTNKRVEEDKDSSILERALEAINIELWSRGNQLDKEAIVAETAQEMELEEGVVAEAGESESYSEMHSSGYRLPSTGASTIFIIISILGIGLMTMAFKRR